MRRCESCGKVFPESKDVFCPHCGAIATSKQVCGCHDSSDVSRYTRANNGQPVSTDPYGNGSRHNDHAPAVAYTPSAQPRPLAQPRRPVRAPVDGKKKVAIIVTVIIAIYFLSAVIMGAANSFFEDDSPEVDFNDPAGYEVVDDDRFYAFGDASDERQTVSAPEAKVAFQNDRLYLFLGDLCETGSADIVLPVDEVNDVAFLWYSTGEGKEYLPDEYGYMRYCDQKYNNSFSFQYIDVPDDGRFCLLTNVEAVTYDNGFESRYFDVQLPFDAVTVENGKVLYWIAEVMEDNTVTFHPFDHA
ncbi:MAG: zinc ribbon domain-containing protein [Clostridia bacterium]|nr:zinc ribbon domain-containing protein [Clostridia bacterium]